MSTQPPPSASAPAVPRRPRLTAHGVGFLLLTLFAGVLALLLGSHYIFLIFATLLAMFGTAAVHARLMLRGVRVQRTVAHPIFSHQPFEVGLRFENAKWLPVASLRVVDGARSHETVRHDAAASGFIPLIPPQGEAVLAYRARVFGRGFAEWTHVTVGTDAPFGLFRSEVELPCPSRAIVYPRMLSVVAQLRLDSLFAPTEMDVTVGRRGAEEFVGLREFRAGDNPRWIHWKASARLPAQLLVREFESPRLRRVVLALETRVDPRERRKLLRRLESGITVAASLAGSLVRNAPALTFVSASPEPIVLDLMPDSRSLWELLETLALLRPSEDMGIREILDLVPSSRLDGAAVVAILLRDDPALAREYPGLLTISAERPSRLLGLDRRSGIAFGGADRFRGGRP